MDFDTLARSDLAVRPHDPRAPEARPLAPSKPAEVLATMMDFSGGVALAELLQAPIPAGPAHPEAGRQGYDLQERVQSQLDALSTRAQERLARERRLESEIVLGDLPELLAQTGASADRAIRPESALRVASELRRRVGWKLGASLRQAQTDLARLRANIAGELRALGPRADQLERIDAALQTSVQRKLGELYERVLRAAEQSFDRACLDACLGLPRGFGEADLASWRSPQGWIARDRERCERTTGAFCVHLRRGVEGLVAAAIQAEVGP